MALDLHSEITHSAPLSPRLGITKYLVLWTEKPTLCQVAGLLNLCLLCQAQVPINLQISTKPLLSVLAAAPDQTSHLSKDQVPASTQFAKLRVQE